MKLDMLELRPCRSASLLKASSLDDVPSARDDVDIGDILWRPLRPSRRLPSLVVPLALVFLTAVKILYVEPMAKPLDSD